MDDADKIRKNNWRQGSVICTDDHDLIDTERGCETPKNARWILISQTCDIVHHSFDAEPTVEILLASPVKGKHDGNCTNGKNPRILHIPININGDSAGYECRICSRAYLSRNLLADRAPDSAAQLNHEILQITTRWLASRYTRTAFPDAFVSRLTASQKKLKKALEKDGSDISGLYIALKPWGEITGTKYYKMVLVGTIREPISNDEHRKAKAHGSLMQIAAVLEKCKGIIVEDTMLLSESEMTLDDIRSMHRWDFDYLSLRQEPAGDLPAIT